MIRLKNRCGDNDDRRLRFLGEAKRKEGRNPRLKVSEGVIVGYFMELGLAEPLAEPFFGVSGGI